jgi:hypothetical protein
MADVSSDEMFSNMDRQFKRANPVVITQDSMIGCNIQTSSNGGIAHRGVSKHRTSRSNIIGQRGEEGRGSQRSQRGWSSE